MRGGWAKDEDLSSAEYWVQHLRNTVRFADAARTVLAGEPSIVIEVGPGTRSVTATETYVTNLPAGYSTYMPWLPEYIAAYANPQNM